MINFELRDYQKSLKTNIYANWQKGHQNLLAVMPTGSGKTKTFCSIVKDLISGENPISDNICPTVVMVHRKELLQQISNSLAEIGVMHNIIAPRKVIKEIIREHRILFGKSFYNYDATASVISVDTFINRANQHQKWINKIRCWICDEAAHALKENKWGKAISYFPRAIGLGVTATPQRLDNKGLGRAYQGVFDKMIQGPTTGWLIKKRYLCDYKFMPPKQDYEKYLREPKKGTDFSKKIMREASKESYIVGKICPWSTNNSFCRFDCHRK